MRRRSARSCRRRCWRRRPGRGSGRRCPGLSGTPISVILASSRLNAMPEMTACSIFSSSSNVISVPERASSSIGDVPRREARQHAQRHAGTCRRTRPSGSAAPSSRGSPSRAFPRSVTRRQPPRLGHDARVGGVDAVDVGVDQALVGLQRRGERDRRRVRAAAAERGDVAVRRRRPGSRRRRRPCRRRGRRGCCASSMLRMRALV